jgi:type IV pilus assembly protein PilV
MKKHNGFTLIEVLIAVIILATGLLGLAGMQAKGLSNNQSAYNRSQATQLAYDIADRMRANPVAASAGQYLSKDFLPSAASCATGDTPCSACASAGSVCDATAMAEKDLFEWNNNLVDVFPSGSGSITQTGVVYTVTINWDDDRDAATADLSLSVKFQL